MNHIFTKQQIKHLVSGILLLGCCSAILFAQPKPRLMYDDLYLPGEFIQKIHTDSLGNVWVIAGQDRRTVYLVSSCGNAEDKSNVFHSLSDSAFTDIVTSGPKQAIVGTKGEYILEYNDGAVMVWDSTHGLMSPIIHNLLYHYDMYSDKWNLYVGTPQYAYLLDSVTFVPWSTSLIFPEMFVLGSRQNIDRGWGYIYAYRTEYISGSTPYRTWRQASSAAYSNNWYDGQNVVDIILSADCVPDPIYPSRANISIGTPDGIVREISNQFVKALEGKRVNKVLNLDNYMLAGTDQGLFLSQTTDAWVYNMVNLPQEYDIQDIDYADGVVYLGTSQGLVRLVNMASCSSSSDSVSISAMGDTLIATVSTSESFSYQWFLDGEPIWDAQDSIYVATEEGAYTVAISSDCISCEEISDEFQLVGVSNLDESDVSELRLEVFPNPTSDQVQVVLPKQMNGQGRLQLFSLTGRKVRTTPIQTGERHMNLSTQGLPPGIYLLEIVQNRQRIGFAKIVKK